MDYQKIHDRIIFRAKIQQRKKFKRNHPDYIYYESHHILPRCIYPEYKNFKEYPWNKVLLTAREHFIIHQLLVKMYPKNLGLIKAANLMTIDNGRQDKRINNRKYDWLRRKHSELLSEVMTGKIVPHFVEANKNRKGKPNGLEGIVCDNRTKEKISKTLSGRAAKNKGQAISSSIKVKCIELDRVFSSCRQAADTIGIKSSNEIKKVAEGKNKSCGGYTWKYIEADKEKNRKNHKGLLRERKKKILCVETNIIYESAAEAIRNGFAGADAAARGVQKTAAGYHWKYI